MIRRRWESVQGGLYALSLMPVALADWLLGPRCDLCGQRVYPKDAPAHTRLDHAGDRA